MTSQGGEHISTETEKEEENFYDCQEIIELPDGTGGVGEKQDKGDSLENLNITTDRLADVRVSTQEKEQVNGLQEEPLNKLQEEDEPLNKQQEEDELLNKQQEEDEPGNKLQEEDQVNVPLDNLDSELKENSQEVEFDDEYLREVEKELTEEEKEVIYLIANLVISIEKTRNNRQCMNHNSALM